MQLVVGKVDGRTVVGGQQVAADHVPGELGQDIPQQEEIAQRFGHFFLVHGDEAVVHPVFGEFVAGGLGLGQLVLMVGEDQVRAAAVDVEGRAQIFAGHGRAFDVPAGPALAPGAVPGGFAGLGRLPQGEIQGVPLHVVHVHPGAGAQVVDVAAGQLAVGGQGAHFEINVAPGLIGVALVDDALDEGDDVRHMLRDFGMHVGLQHVQGLGVLEIGGDIFFGQRKGVDAFLIGPVDDLVVHVGEVLHVGHVIAPPQEIAAHRVEDHQGTGVAQMDEVVHRGAAAVDAHFALFAGHELLFLGAHGIVKSDGHNGSPCFFCILIIISSFGAEGKQGPRYKFGAERVKQGQSIIFRRYL